MAIRLPSRAEIPSTPRASPWVGSKNSAAENRWSTSGVWVLFAMFTHEICDVRPKQMVGVPGMQFLPPWPASATTSVPLKNSTPRGLSKPAATSVGIAGAPAPAGVGTKTATAINTTAAKDKRNFQRISSTPLPPLNAANAAPQAASDMVRLDGESSQWAEKPKIADLRYAWCRGPAGSSLDSNRIWTRFPARQFSTGSPVRPTFAP